MKRTAFRDFHRLTSDDYRAHQNGLGRIQRLTNPSGTHENVEAVSVRFDHIEEHLLDLISASEIVLGAVAWLTNSRLLEAMAGLKRAAFVVQKEDFLREDANSETKSHLSSRLRAQYTALSPLSFNDFQESYPGQQDGMPNHNQTIDNWLIAADGQYLQDGDAVRCLGYRRDQSRKAVPTMHHKFAVFGSFEPDIVIRPMCVVTGSFNWSANAIDSRENLVTIYDNRVCENFVSEWAQLWALSEPLNWHNPGPDFPNHYVGT